MTQDLYTATDVKKVREILLEEQGGKCAVLGIDIKAAGRTAVLDHAHDEEQYVRGVLERELNAFVGAAENAYRRHLGYWLPTPLPDVLRAVAAYLERPDDTRYRHNGWIRRLTTKFNKLPAAKQNLVLQSLCGKQGSNPAARKKLWSTVVKDRNLGYNTILNTLKGANDA